MFRTFTRNWYCYGHDSAGRRVVRMPKRMPRRNWTGHSYQTEQEARDACRRYNEATPPGPLSHKMEYTRD